MYVATFNLDLNQESHPPASGTKRNNAANATASATGTAEL